MLEMLSRRYAARYETERQRTVELKLTARELPYDEVMWDSPTFVQCSVASSARTVNAYVVKFGTVD